MKSHLLAASILSCAILSCAILGTAVAQVTPATDAQLTKAQVKQLLREAHSPDQYKVLAGYYGEQQASYLKEAAEEKQEWDRRSQNIVGVAAKYPRPVDSARNLYEYYMYKASEMGALSSKYGQLGSTSIPQKLQ